MRIAILTFQRSLSYGAFFQAFALAKYLEGSGHDVSIIDYMPTYRQRYFRLVSPLRWTWGGVNRGNLRALLNIPRAYRRNSVLNGDVSRHLPLTIQQYHTLDELQRDSPPFDACVLGSDQIWNPENTGGEFDGAFFGQFGKDSMLRISYAASFGRAQLSGQSCDKLQVLLDRLDSISVREKSGIGIVHAASGKHAVETLDPTFLIDVSRFPANKQHVARDPYVLGYFLQPSRTKAALLQLAAETLGMKAHRIDDVCRSMPRWGFLGPVAMLSWIQNAAHVVTDSFHGLALSIIHRVDVTPTTLTGGLAGRNERLRNLLANIDLSQRLIDASATMNSTPKFDSIEWDAVEDKLSGQRLRSMAFLDDALGSNRCELIPTHLTTDVVR